MKTTKQAKMILSKRYEGVYSKENRERHNIWGKNDKK